MIKSFQEYLNEGYSNTEKESLVDYKFNSKYIPVNKALRGKIPHTEEIDEIIANIDSAMKKGKTFSGTLYKGVIQRIGFKSGFKIGEIVEFKNYISATKNINIAKKYGDTVLKLSVKSSPSINMDDKKLSARATDEKEILLDRGLKFKVKSIKGNIVEIYQI